MYYKCPWPLTSTIGAVECNNNIPSSGIDFDHPKNKNIIKIESFKVKAVNASNSTTSPSIEPSVAPSDICSVGFYSSTGQLPCSPCPIGHYVDIYGATSCFPCATGKYSLGGTASCAFCPSDQNSAPGSSACYNFCPAGYYPDQSLGGSCSAISSGRHTYQKHIILTSYTNHGLKAVMVVHMQLMDVPVLVQMVLILLEECPAARPVMLAYTVRLDLLLVALLVLVCILLTTANIEGYNHYFEYFIRLFWGRIR